MQTTQPQQRAQWLEPACSQLSPTAEGSFCGESWEQYQLWCKHNYSEGRLSAGPFINTAESALEPLLLLDSVCSWKLVCTVEATGKRLTMGPLNFISTEFAAQAALDLLRLPLCSGVLGLQLCSLSSWDFSTCYSHSRCVRGWPESVVTLISLSLIFFLFTIQMIPTALYKNICMRI